MAIDGTITKFACPLLIIAFPTAGLSDFSGTPAYQKTTLVLRLYGMRSWPAAVGGAPSGHVTEYKRFSIEHGFLEQRVNELLPISVRAVLEQPGYCS